MMPLQTLLDWTRQALDADKKAEEQPPEPADPMNTTAAEMEAYNAWWDRSFRLAEKARELLPELHERLRDAREIVCILLARSGYRLVDPALRARVVALFSDQPPYVTDKVNLTGFSFARVAIAPVRGGPPRTGRTGMPARVEMSDDGETWVDVTAASVTLTKDVLVLGGFAPMVNGLGDVLGYIAEYDNLVVRFLRVRTAAPQGIAVHACREGQPGSVWDLEPMLAGQESGHDG